MSRETSSGGDASPGPAPGGRPLVARIDGRGDAVEPAEGWTLTPLEADGGVVRLGDGRRTLVVAVDGEGSEWQVVIRGRSIRVTVRSWREELLAEAAGDAALRAGPVDVRASLPGLVVAVQATVGDEVAEGDPLLRIEAMKMQNELRAPRPGRVAAILVEAGQAVAAGEVLLRLE